VTSGSSSDMSTPLHTRAAVDTSPITSYHESRYAVTSSFHSLWRCSVCPHD
jgi:hypothetical protein